jgi:hypothetical protein
VGVPLTSPTSTSRSESSSMTALDLIREDRLGYEKVRGKSIRSTDQIDLLERVVCPYRTFERQ